MRTEIHVEPDRDECLVEIRCPAMDKEVAGILQALALTESILLGRADGAEHRIPLRQVLYLESVEDRTFFYTASGTYECALRLYQAEEQLARWGFVRISRSVVASLWHMRSLKRERNRTLLVELTNGEKLRVSRMYLAGIRQRLLEDCMGGKERTNEE